MGRRREHGVKLPDGVHRVTARGKVYYYAWRGKGAPRLPDPETDPEGFAKALRLAHGMPAHKKGSIAALIAEFAGDEHTPPSAEWQALKPASQRDYRWHLNVVLERWGEFQADAIRPAHIREIRNSFGDRPVLANHLLSVIRVLWSFGREHNWPLGDPAAEVKRYRVKSDGRKPWPAWAFEIAEGHFRPELRRLYFLGRYTGQRLSDCLAMHWRMIDAETIRVRQSKTDKEIIIPIHPALRPELDRARQEGTLYLVSRADGRPYSPQDFQAMWSREMKKAPQKRIKDEGFSFHGLRKNAVTALAVAGCDPSEIRSITGQTLQMVNHYLGTWEQPTLAKSAMAKWAKHLEEGE